MEIDIAKILNAVDEINRIPTSRPLQSTDGLFTTEYKVDLLKVIKKM